MITQARKLPTQPESLGDPVDLRVDGEFGDLDRLRDTAVALFEQLESIYHARGVPLGIGVSKDLFERSFDHASTYPNATIGVV